MDSGVKYKKFVASQQDVDDEKPSTVSDSRSTKYLVIIMLLIIAVMAALSAVAIGVGVGVSVSKPQPVVQQGLTTITVTPEELEGEYYGQDGGIRFRSTVNSTYIIISITTSSGEPLVFVLHPVVSNMTMMSVNETNFMVMENQPGRAKYDDYLVPNDAMNMMESIVMGEEKMSDDVYKYLDNTTVNETRQSVFYNLAMSKETLLIIEAAQALGDRGIRGVDYPAVMRFYLLALRLANSRDDTAGADSTTPGGKLFDRHRQTRATRCSSNGAICETNRCPFKRGSNDCFGLCGKGCSCWSFVCNNCCVNQYCRTHDQCCADKGFFSSACLSVAWKAPSRFGTQSLCSSNYDC